MRTASTFDEEGPSNQAPFLFEIDKFNIIFLQDQKKYDDGAVILVLVPGLHRNVQRSAGPHDHLHGPAHHLQTLPPRPDE